MASPTQKSVQELSNPQKDGFLFKYGVKGLGANWSKRWFVLRDGYLYYFKTGNSSKQSGVISLSTYNKLSEAGKTRKFSFKLESTNPKTRVYYLSAESEDELTAWRREIISSIKGRALSNRKSISMHSLLEPSRKICTMYINVSEARNLPISDRISGKIDPYLIADAGGCQARTRTIYKSLSPFWGEEFHLNIVDTFTRDPAASIKITVWDEDKFTKDTLVGQVVIPLMSLSDSKIHEQWYPLFSFDAEIYVSGDLHVRVDHNTEAKNLTVRILEGRNLASKDANGLSDPYVKVTFGRAKKKTKVVKKNLNPFFNEEFVFEIPETFYNPPEGKDVDPVIMVSCWDWDRLGSNEFMGEFVIRLNELEPDTIHDMWYTLLPKGDLSVPVDNNASSLNLLALTAPPPTQTKPLGEVRMKLKYTEDIALPVYIYQPLLELLHSHNGPLLAQLMEQVIGPSERGELATTIIVACEGYGTAVPLIIALSKDEIQHSQEETMFRGNSVVTKGLDAYMKLVATQYLDHVVGPTIKKIYNYKKSCEVDPTREKEENIPKNFQRLLKLCQTIINAIVSSATVCPPRLREIFHNLQQFAVDKHGANSPAKYSVVSSFLFLRHICPAILNPKLFGLAADHPDQRTARVLTLVSKTIQNLANLVTFGQKEPYMLTMNDFILAHMAAMKTFIDHISTPPAGTTPDPPPIKTEEETVQACAALLRFVERAMPDLQALANEPVQSEDKKEVVHETMVVFTRIKQYRNTLMGVTGTPS